MTTPAYIELVELPTRPEPVMPSACQTGGCGGGPVDERVREAPPSFGRVVVNGVEIEPEAIARELQHHPAADGEAAWRAAARALVMRELLLQEARRLGLAAEPELDAAGGLETTEDALVRALLERQLQPAEVGESECQRYYASNSGRFRTPDLTEASHILLEPGADDDDAWAAAEAEARRLIAEVADDPEAFASAARHHSKCPTAQQGGSLGQVRRGELVAEVQAALDGLTEGGTLKEPVRTSFGVHLLRLQRRITGRSLPYEIVRPKIAEMLEARAWSIAAACYAATLAEAAHVEGILLAPNDEGAER